MAESIAHIDFVSKVFKQAKTLVPFGHEKLICVDSPESISKPPHLINGFIPDVYYNFGGLLIIGEAKTANDVEREHSISQYESYVDEVIKFNGTGVIIFASPWFTKGTIKNTMKRILKKRNFLNITIYFLTEFDEVEQL